MEESPVKAEAGTTRHSAGYKSWKKKYRKMRIMFDQKMHEGEELHRQEDKAAALVKRLAVENDRILDILLEINNSPQIPFEKRIDVSLEPPDDPKAPVLPIDRDHELTRDSSIRSLRGLLSEVPHSSYKQAKVSHPSIVAEIQPPAGELYPSEFLAPDDIDNYLYDIDIRLNPDAHVTTLAPRAHPDSQPQPNPQLKNPTSVTNWLRKHAPKVFLQDGETHHDTEDGDAHPTGRKPRGGRGERGGKATTRAKRISVAARAVADREKDKDKDKDKDKAGDWDVSMDDDPDFASTPVPRAKRKRNDDDTGYKPRGSSTRPAKKKRKSEAVDGTPSARKSKKDIAAANKED